jgi:hypothetical protein
MSQKENHLDFIFYTIIYINYIKYYYKSCIQNIIKFCFRNVKYNLWNQELYISYDNWYKIGNRVNILYFDYTSNCLFFIMSQIFLSKKNVSPRNI